MILANALTELLESRNVWVIVPLGAFLIPIFGIIFGSFAQMRQNAEVEKSRREVAAYVAEGSMTPEEAERLMNSGPNAKRSKRSRA